MLASGVNLRGSVFMVLLGFPETACGTGFQEWVFPSDQQDVAHKIRSCPGPSELVHRGL